jgi:adenylosuccinate lyase
MIKRYTRPEMGEIFSSEARFEFLLQVEIAVAKAQGELGLIPEKAAKSIASKGAFDLARIEELEKTTKHDVIAFVSSVAEKVGPDGRYVHYGMTSSDVLDTALSVQVKKAGAILLQTFSRLETALKEKAKEHAETLCAGRTHGMHAEATTFGLKLAGHLAEFQRNRERLERALEGMRIAKLSGAVGTYATQTPKVEAKVAELLDLKPETVATQVIPRDRHAELISALALIGGAIERLSVELRHLQRTELSEALEGFTKGQKGSSAMPHKRNPISAENLTGAARLLRAYAGAAFEDVALWHERDISHSSVERVIFPDAFILCDYACDRMATLIDTLEVDSERMLANMNLSQGQLFSSQVLLALIDKGQTREDAYKQVQSICHSLKPGEHLKERLKKEKVVDDKNLDAIFGGKALKKSASAIIERTLKGSGK